MIEGRFQTGSAPGNREDSHSVLRLTERKSRKVKTMITMKLGLLSAGFILGAASLVEAQQLQHCAPREKVVERLADKYGETRQSMGLGSNNAVMEVFASVESGSWTITVTMSNGITCLVASGQAFEELAEVLPPKGDDA
ncbi:hypothetical protein SSE37_11279 [Sagittula stellata E-37]|uniref:Uncharacterized protein n=2 Tax=Sagittula stellata TaxID=52603 RepID=A3K3K8_SAGS3|nr:hypothetical protein SSE37_11279 [Sagittula stellata E-37]